ncbi:MAG: hypothetical protein J5626_07250, partial [Lachnospiraceae bacterium]|nr:hypothetical protein [Lachnospiraceae bacterium]
MTADSFVELILKEYGTSRGRELKAVEKATSRDYIVSDVSGEQLSGEVTGKLAALILYKSLQRLTDEKDDDWGPARNFKDIYDCRVCANAVAQVFVKGIMEPLSSDEFGMTRTLTDEESETSVKRLFERTKRV